MRFYQIELSEDATPEQRARFEQMYREAQAEQAADWGENPHLPPEFVARMEAAEPATVSASYALCDEHAQNVEVKSTRPLMSMRCFVCGEALSQREGWLCSEASAKRALAQACGEEIKMGD